MHIEVIPLIMAMSFFAILALVGQILVYAHG